jgi:cellulose synthase/poly-beta-1,6-N-acetylglucosamine synthase-like glycosyltransferase
MAPAKQVTRAEGPFITIAIPTRNRAALLRGCVASALAQTYQNIEVLVCNNASTDNTSAVLKSFNDPRVREIVNPENIGLEGNWNKCVFEARGKYLVVMSDDNTLKPSFLEQCVGLLEQEPNLPIVVGAFDIAMTAENRTVPAILPTRLRTGIVDGTAILIEHLQGNLSCGTLSAAIRTDILRNMGGFPTEYVGGGEEELAMAQILFEGRAGFIREPCASHLFHTHATQRYSLEVNLDTRFLDLYRAMEAVSDAAGRMICNETTCREVQEATRTYVWLRAIEELALSRQHGVTLIDAIRHLWAWRKLLARSSISNFVTALRVRLLGQIVLPASATRLIRTRSRAIAEPSPKRKASGETASVPSSL